jgi:hypothetical protein
MIVGCCLYLWTGICANVTTVCSTCGGCGTGLLGISLPLLMMGGGPSTITNITSSV